MWCDHEHSLTLALYKFKNTVGLLLVKNNNKISHIYFIILIYKSILNLIYDLFWVRSDILSSTWPWLKIGIMVVGKGKAASGLWRTVRGIPCQLSAKKQAGISQKSLFSKHCHRTVLPGCLALGRWGLSGWSRPGWQTDFLSSLLLCRGLGYNSVAEFSAQCCMMSSCTALERCVSELPKISERFGNDC